MSKTLASPFGRLFNQSIDLLATDYRKENNLDSDRPVPYEAMNVFPIFSLFLCYYLKQDNKIRIIDKVNHTLSLSSDEMLSLFDLEKGGNPTLDNPMPYSYFGLIIRRLCNRAIERNNSLIKLNLKEIEDAIKFNDRYEEKTHRLLLNQIDKFRDLLFGYLASKKEYRANMYIVIKADCLAKPNYNNRYEEILVSQRDKYTLDRMPEEFYVASVPIKTIKYLYNNIEAHYNENFIKLGNQVVKISRKIEEVKSKSELLATFPVKDLDNKIKELKENETKKSE